MCVACWVSSHLRASGSARSCGVDTITAPAPKQAYVRVRVGLGVGVRERVGVGVGAGVGVGVSVKEEGELRRADMHSKQAPPSSAKASWGSLR